MDWSDVGDIVAEAAPLIGGILGGPAGAAVGSMVASAFGAEPNPDAVAAAVQGDPEAALKLRRLEQEHIRELERMHLEAETSRLAQINKTMRAEAAANDPYVRRWRPTFGYVAALTWAAQIGATAYAVIGSPARAAEIIQAVTALTPMWSVALAVLGISISKRSADKQVAAGQRPSGALAGLLSGIIPGAKAGK